MYIFMELGVKGDLLGHVKLTEAVKENFAHFKFQQLAPAIKHCHDLNVANRDLKSAHILPKEHLNVKMLGLTSPNICLRVKREDLFSAKPSVDKCSP